MPRPIQREHTYQKTLNKWVREYVVEPKVFLAFDRAKAPGYSPGAQMAAQARQKARGVKTGTPDTLLCVPGVAPIWWECKGAGQKPSAAQEAIGDALMAVSHWWSWGCTVAQYADWIHSIGVPLAPGWFDAAGRADLGVKAAIERAEMKRGKVPARFRVAGAKPTAKRIQRFEKVRGEVRF